MMLLLVNGIFKDYLKMIYLSKMVSWLQNLPDSAYLLILKLKDKIGLQKKWKTLLTLKDQSPTKPTLNSKISS